MNKYGVKNFTIELIVDNVPIEFLNSFEKFWINFYDSRNSGYNLTLGGEGIKGYIYTEGDKRKMKKTKEQKMNHSRIIKGRNKPKDFGKKIIKIKLGVKTSPQHSISCSKSWEDGSRSEKFSNYWSKGENYNIFDSLGKLKYKIRETNILKFCKENPELSSGFLKKALKSDGVIRVKYGKFKHLNKWKIERSNK